jgi:hypothetical protein
MIEEKWRPLWNQYISNVYDEACSATLDTVTPTFARILPRTGPVNRQVRVQVFGKNFERGICNEGNIKCRFGVHESVGAEYVTNQEVVCIVPKLNRWLVDDGETVAVSITFDGTEYFDTGEEYTFYHGWH